MSVERAWRWAVLLAAAAAFACGGGTGKGSAQTELQRVKAGSLELVLLSGAPALAQGKGAFTLEFHGADGALVDVGTVRVAATMPMAGMPPMFGTVGIERTGTPGRYAATTDLGMASGWQMSLDWDGPGGRGSVRFQQMVR